MPLNEQQPIKNSNETSFFDVLPETAKKLSPEYQRWRMLLRNTSKTIAEATEQQSLATLLAARTTGRYALVAGTTAAIAAGFVWYEQRKLDSQSEELNKK